MWDTAGEARANSNVMLSLGALHMDVSELADQELLTAALYGHGMLSGRPTGSDRGYGWLRREREVGRERVR